MRLDGKKALVTGGGRGIGAGCALELAREGADVVINDLQSSPAAETLVGEIEKLGRKAWLVEGDAFERDSCEAIVGRALGHLGRIDIFISNPAFSRRQPFLQYDPQVFERVIKGVMTGGFHTSQFVARQMVAQGGGGKILFIVSVHSEVPYANSVAYNAGKAGLKHMAFTIANELLPHRINVNVIDPGWIDTPGERSTFGDTTMDEAGSTIPWGRLGQPRDIGRAAVFLVSGDADYITGTSLKVDGGLWLKAAQE